MFRKSGLLSFLIALTIGCMVDDLPLEGRSCDEQHACGAPMVCEPATRTCRRAADLAVDLGIDFQEGDLTPPDGAADADSDDQTVDIVPPKKLHCEAPEIVGTVGDTVSLGTPALRIDGLTLVAKSSGSAKSRSTTRSGIDEPFGAWTAFALPAERADPYYFEWNGQEQLIMTTSGESPRQLWLCSVAEGTIPCEAIDVLDETGTKIVHDMDGPSVVPIGNSLLMAFNIQPGEVADVFLAEPKDPTSLSVWIASPAGASNDPILHEDDPALSSDGRVLVFERKSSSDADWDLWAAYRDDTVSGFSVAEPLASLNGSANDGSPALYGSVADKLELYFTSDRVVAKTNKVYRSSCEMK